MSPTYLVEHAEAARIALDLAEREAAHLRYTYNTLFGEPIDRAWPAFARLLGGQAKSLVDTLAYAERMEWISSGEEFVGARKLRNLLVHEYMTEPDLFLDALLAAKPATQVLFQVIRSVKQEALSRGLGALQNRESIGFTNQDGHPHSPSPGQFPGNLSSLPNLIGVFNPP